MIPRIREDFGLNEGPFFWGSKVLRLERGQGGNFGHSRAIYRLLLFRFKILRDGTSHFVTAELCSVLVTNPNNLPKHCRWIPLGLRAQPLEVVWCLGSGRTSELV